MAKAGQASLPRFCRRPVTASATSTPKVTSRAKPANCCPPSRVSSHRSASAVSPIGIAITRRKVFIHGPGLGRRLRKAGTKPSSRNGRASPSPSIANSSMAGSGGSNSAAPRAAAMNGPVHGVATKAAKRPVANDDPPPPFPASDSEGTSNRPAKLAVIATASTSSATTTPGSCNWKAQPTSSPPARSTSNSAPIAMQASTTPAV